MKVRAYKFKTLRDPRELGRCRTGEVLVTESTDPDWEPVMKMAAAIVTERGGRTSHAAIVCAKGALEAISNDAPVTVSCAEGEVGVV